MQDNVTVITMPIGSATTKEKSFIDSKKDMDVTFYL